MEPKRRQTLRAGIVIALRAAADTRGIAGYTTAPLVRRKEHAR